MIRACRAGAPGRPPRDALSLVSRTLASLLLLLLSQPAAAAAQATVTVAELRTLMNEQRHAVELYREGRIDEALAIVRSRTASMNHVIAERILQWREGPKPQIRDTREQPVQHWDRPLVAALASLHMEIALRLYAERASVDAYRAQVRTASMLLDAIKGDGSPPNSLRRWILAIGSTAHADGQLWWAAEILDEGCRSYPDDVDLLVACASVQESIAALPAHILLAGGRFTTNEEGVRFGADAAQQAVAARNRRLGAARRLLEHALTIRPADVEAQLRLAGVLALAGDEQRSAPFLEAIVKLDEKSDRRSAFLARLLLGRMRLRLGALPDAVRLFEECVTLVPSAQSGYVALAHALHRSGKVAEAASVTERMFKAPAQPPDPWGSYSYGQYWIAEPLLASLRAEVRK